jgi:hypothetical protein
VERSIAQAGVEFRCDTDFLALRVLQALEKIKAEAAGEEPPILTPGFCHVTPAVLDMNLPPESRTSVEIAGWDLDQLDATGANLKILLVSDHTGEVIELPEARIGRTTHYWITVNVFGADFEQLITAKKITKLRLAWGSYSKGLPEVIVLPRVPKVDTVVQTFGEVTHYPKHVGGDPDFDTGPSEPMFTIVRVETKAEENKVMVRLYMYAKEGEADYTKAESASEWMVAYAAPAGYKIKGVSPLGSVERSLTITSHGAHEIKLPQGEVVYRFEIYGDHKGPDAGTYTRVVAYFNDASVELEEILP